MPRYCAVSEYISYIDYIHVAQILCLQSNMLSVSSYQQILPYGLTSHNVFVEVEVAFSTTNLDNMKEVGLLE